MLLTWYKNNNFPNLWLDLDYQLEEEDIYKKNATYIHQIYNNGLLKLKNMDNFVVGVSIYMHFCLWILFGIYYRDSIHYMFIKKNHMCKRTTKKKLTKKHYGLLNGLKWAIFSKVHIIIIFGWISIFIFWTCTFKLFLEWLIFIWAF